MVVVKQGLACKDAMPVIKKMLHCAYALKQGLQMLKEVGKTNRVKDKI